MYQLRKIEIHLRIVHDPSNFEPARFTSVATRRYNYPSWRGEILVARFSTDLQVAPKGTGRTG